MARPRQPVDLLLYKGKKNLTKAEIEQRKAQEIKAANDKVKPPNYLPKDLKKEFKKIASELLQIGIMTNLDVDALARFLYARKMYIKVTDALLETELTVQRKQAIHDGDGAVIDMNEWEEANAAYSDLLINQDKLFKQCRSAASDLGLTIASRCKLVIPKQKKQEPSEVEKTFGDL
ncbi:phage terminase small subunit P27 family [Brevibacillus laterosporus]|uniref:Phage terminase small subunit P27 family n=1 Tax=Brevibacillus halotolerans TaxID=1507437 RepID=A0ABT4HR17_9BACL|nr:MULTISPECIES: phage terminase small subunit P27 family [Brevibacillus]MCR8983528.1 phage terminase small subunit P27 family [Brevibacillus laterosporus]MCZ0829246.1 phage terminase small subunit P27 family [Brevibacillus halotolerans]